MVSQQTIRRIVLTGSISAVTITGAIYGAGLKFQQEHKQAQKTVYELPVEERIAGLQTKRARLVSQKEDLERKIAGLEARRPPVAKSQPSD
ncbi:uncharacterized protein BKCO1_1600016 [Diplodia corticola]|uniref:Uncharacterized protein n=1 Tax=Diplodia corticola TaxID=236234 RepID=A0A1J9R4U7_9PEZI|nr:uncharacterized protein BKCO1_1600016 [Diplodia corticola]OJD35624.1 hypothetical protein BKCO1_1600016 [Diplodia corticola]